MLPTMTSIRPQRKYGCADEMHPVQAVLDDLRVGRVNAKKLLAEKNEPVSQDQTNHTDKNQADTLRIFFMRWRFPAPMF